MIEHLAIRNLALLDVIELNLEKGFTAVTGETGAGKSILLSALTLLAGDKADKAKIRQGEDQCEIVGHITIAPTSPIHAFLVREGLPACEEGLLLLRRTIDRNKAGKAWINGVSVPRSTLEELASFWIDFNGPQSPHRLSNEAEQRLVLDEFSDIQIELELYQEKYKVLQSIEKSIEELQSKSHLSEDERLFYQEQFDKIHRAVPSEENILQLEKAYADEEKYTALQEQVHILTQGLGRETGLGQHLRKLLKPAQELMELDPALKVQYDRLQALSHEADDLSYDYARALPDRPQGESFANLEGRMNQWLSIRRSHGPTLGHVLARKKALEDRLTSQETVAERLAELELARDATLKKLAPLAHDLEKKRTAGAQKLSVWVEKVLPDLGLPKARFEILFHDEAKFMPHGMTRTEFRLATNVGQPLMPLSKVASSGEKARVMLAIKGVTAQVQNNPMTLVFDEIDANVGGEVGVALGKVMAEIAQHHQIMAITHLPQVASRAPEHIVVTKSQGEMNASIQIQSLHGSDPLRLQELARMLGDRNLESAQNHAAALLAKS